jgi:hypothetical protein
MVGQKNQIWNAQPQSYSCNHEVLKKSSTNSKHRSQIQNWTIRLLLFEILLTLAAWDGPLTRLSPSDEGTIYLNYMRRMYHFLQKLPINHLIRCSSQIFSIFGAGFPSISLKAVPC